MLAGARISFLVGLTVVSVSAVVGTILGAMAGYLGGVWDDVISRVIDTLLAFPGLLLAIALVAVLGPSLLNVLIALTIIGWVGYARLVRGRRCARANSSTCTRGLARSARGPWHILSAARHSRGDSGRGRPGDARDGGRDHRGSVAQFSRARGSAADRPAGALMLNGGRAHILDAPHLTIFPGLAIAILVLGFNFIGDGLRDATDPKRAA